MKAVVYPCGALVCIVRNKRSAAIIILTGMAKLGHGHY